MGNDTLHALVMGILTGSTCGFACWEAREDKPLFVRGEKMTPRLTD